MTSNKPTAKNLANLYKLAPLDWQDVRAKLEVNLTQGPGPGGPGQHTFWLSTVDADGGPHMAAVGALWIDAVIMTPRAVTATAISSCRPGTPRSSTGS
jgi:hypothetical protein